MEIIDLSLHCHHDNDSCIIKKMGSDGSHCNASFTVRDKVTKQCPQTSLFEEKGQPKRAGSSRGLSAYQPNALPLGQTSSLLERKWGRGGGGRGWRKPESLTP